MSRRAEARSFITIGDALKELRADFPDVTISKIRFLEAEGLIEPERTPSGYRKFSTGDLARLRHVLQLQRDHFMPLKVIRQRLEDFDPDLRMDLHPKTRPNRSPRVQPGARPAIPPPPPEEEDFAGFETGVSLSLEELAASSGVDRGQLQELEEYGLIDSQRAGGASGYDEDDLLIARIARDFAKFGIEPRHLKMYRNFVDREFALFEQVVGPRSRTGAPDGRRQQSMTELARLSKRLKQILLRTSLRSHIDQ
ncbi:MAG TPA: MerR family transcriptional regulator [Actinomycetota bacterium]|jgi:DNA-binding transcriptional MerR regulator